MADPVEIQNVGGLRGVASEVTLLELRDSIREMNRGGSTRNNARLDARLQENYNRALAGSVKQQGLFNKAIDSTVESLKGFSKEFAFGGNRVGDFAEAIFGASSSITGLIRYLDNTVDTFRSLTTVGANFNNSMFDMISAAANSGLELGQYASFVRQNSEIMKVFGGTTTLGAKRFGELSKQLRNSAVGDRLFEMGFTIQDLNDGLVNYIDLQVRLGRRETLSTRDLTAATAEYMTDLDALAKVTGKTREEFANIAERIAADGRIRALADRATAAGADNLTKNLAAATAMFPGLGDSILNIASGYIGDDDMAKALESALGPAGAEFSNIIRNAGNMTEDEFIDRMSDVGPALSDYLKSLDATTLAYYRTQGGIVGAIASIADMGYQFDQTAMANMRAAREEQARESAFTSIFTKFENAIISARKYIVDLFIDSALADEFAKFGDELSKLFGNNSGGLTWMQNLLRRTFNLLAGPDGILTNAVRWMTAALRPGGPLETAFESLQTWFTNFTKSVEEDGLWNTLYTEITKLFKNTLDYVFGWTEQIETPSGTVEVERQGLIDRLYEYVFGDENTKPGESLYDQFLTKIGLNSTSGEDVFKQVGDKIYTLLFGKRVRVRGPDEYEQRGGLLTELFGGKNEAGEEVQGFLTTAYNWLVDTLFGTKPEGSNERQDGLLDTAFNWIMDSLFPADTPDMKTWDRIIDTIMDGIFGEQIKLFGVDTGMRPGYLKLEKAMNDWLGLSFIEQMSGGPSLWEQILLKVGLDTTGETTLWQAILEKVGLDGAEGAPGVLEQIGTKIYDAIFGKEVRVGPPDSEETERRGGILESITTGFSDLFKNSTIVESLTSAFQGMFDAVINGFVNFWESDSANRMKDIVINMFNEIYIKILEMLDAVPGIDMSSELRAQSFSSQERLLSGGSISNAEAENIKTQLENDIATLQDMIDGPAWLFSSQESIDETTNSLDFLTQRLANVNAALSEAEANSHATGTSGFQDFGKKSYATLHGVEAVVPKNSAEGRLLDAFYATQGQNFAKNQEQPQPVIAPAPDQSSLIKKVEELNTTMVRVVELLQNSVGLQEKTVKGVKNLNTDFYRGIG